MNHFVQERDQVHSGTKKLYSNVNNWNFRTMKFINILLNRNY